MSPTRPRGQTRARDAFRNTTVRQARRFDTSRLAVLEPQIFRGYYTGHRFNTEQFRRYLAQPNTIAYIAEKHGVMVGYVLGIQRRDARRTVRLLSIGIIPEEEGQGTGHRLLRAFLREATRRGSRIIFLEVAAVNLRARTLFEAHSFVAIRGLPAYYTSHVSGVRMRRRE